MVKHERPTHTAHPCTIKLEKPSFALRLLIIRCSRDVWRMMFRSNLAPNSESFKLDVGIGEHINQAQGGLINTKSFFGGSFIFSLNTA